MERGDFASVSGSGTPVPGQGSFQATDEGGGTERPASFRMAYEQVKHIAAKAEGDCCFTITNCCDHKKRREHRRTAIFHRTSPLSFWFMIIILGVAAIVGAFTPHLKKVDIKSGKSNLDINENTVDINSALYWLTYFTWSSRWYIQALLNFTRGRTIGLNINYVMWSLIATMSHAFAIGIAIATDRNIASFDRREVEVDTKMLVYIVSALFSTMIVLFQCWSYDGYNSQRPNATVNGTIILAAIFTIIYLIVNLGVIQDDNGASMAITRYMYACEIFSLLCSVVKFIPQILQHRQYGVYIGVDILMVFMEILGALSLFILIFYKTVRQNNFNFSKFETFRDVINVEIRQLIQCIFIIILGIYLIVQLFYYWSLPTPDEIESRVSAMKTNKGLKRPSVGMASVPREGQHDHHHRKHTHTKHTNEKKYTASTPNSAAGSAATTPGTIIDNDGFGTPASAAALDQAFGKGPSATSKIGSKAAKWLCPVCTYKNDSSHVYCAMCETPFDDVMDDVEMANL
jgi:hypothetical protein